MRRNGAATENISLVRAAARATERNTYFSLIPTVSARRQNGLRPPTPKGRRATAQAVAAPDLPRASRYCAAPLSARVDQARRASDRHCGRRYRRCSFWPSATGFLLRSACRRPSSPGFLCSSPFLHTCRKPPVSSYFPRTTTYLHPFFDQM